MIIDNRIRKALEDFEPVKVGVAGTGFIARGIVRILQSHPRLQVSRVLTRRLVDDAARHIPRNLLTNSAEECIAESSIFLECSGDPFHAAELLLACAEAKIPVATMNPEAQVTVGSALVARGAYLSDCLGDQPGCLAELHHTALALGMEPLCYINLKGFMDLNPSPESMRYWADKQGLSLEQTTSFTDGTKLQIEQALVANGLGARLSKRAMEGPTVADLAELDALAETAIEIGCPISDYALNPGGPPGVLMLVQSEEMARHPGYTPFERLKTSKGLAFRILRPHHLTHMESILTLDNIASGQPPLINNGARPTTTVVAVAKRPLAAGSRIERGLGSFEVRGEACDVEEAGLEFAPITLVANATLRRSVEPGETLRFADIDIPETLALRLYRESLEGLLSDPAAVRKAPQRPATIGAAADAPVVGVPI